MGDRAPAILCLGDMLFDSRRGALTDKNGARIPLRPQSLDVLTALAARPGTMVGKETLIAEVWGHVAVTDDSLTQCIADIRRALGDSDHKIIQTMPKKGYRLVVQQAKAPAKMHMALAAALCVLLLAVLGGAWQYGTTPASDGPPIEWQASRSEPSIAVLPFESIATEERWTRLGRGLAAEIAAELALNDWLYVTVPESFINVAFGTLPEGRPLDARFALAGTLQAQGEDIRISAHMTDVSTGEVLWSQTWTAPQNDIFAVQDRIVARIGASLASSYSGAVVQADLKRAKRKLTSDLSAYEHYLIAFEEFHRFDPETYPDVIEHLEAALKIDPGFAGALVTLSVVQRSQARETQGAAAQEWLEASQASAYRAYAIDPNNPNVLWNVAYAYALDGQLEIAARTLRRAVEIAPNNADVLMISAGYSNTVGIGGAEPLSWAQRALELNPLAPAWWYSDLGEAAFAAGNYDLAIDSMKRAPQSSSTTWLVTALSEAHKGNLDAAAQAANRARELAPGLTMEDFAGGSEADRPDQHRLFEIARLLSIPISEKELALTDAAAATAAPPLPAESE